MSSSFLYPWVLLLLVLPAGLLYWTWLRSGRQVMRPVALSIAMPAGALVRKNESRSPSGSLAATG